MGGGITLAVFGLTVWREVRRDRAAARTARLAEAREVAGEVSDAIAANQVAILHLRAEARGAWRTNVKDVRPVIAELGVAQRALVAASFRLRATAPEEFIVPLEAFLAEAEVLGNLVAKAGDPGISDDEWDDAVVRWGRAHLRFAQAIRHAAFGD